MEKNNYMLAFGNGSGHARGAEKVQNVLITQQSLIDRYFINCNKKQSVKMFIRLDQTD